MAKFSIPVIALLPIALCAGINCTSTADCKAGFFCHDRFPTPVRTCEKLLAGAPCGVDNCGGDAYFCHPLTSTCALRPDYSKSALPLGFARCNSTTNNCNGNMCATGECWRECARGGCHVPGVLSPCTGAENRTCPLMTTCIDGACAYGTEGVPCDRSADEPCLRGMQCVRRVGRRGAICTKGLVGMPCATANRCAPGLVCGTSGRCARSADGQPCASDFFCPPGFLCSRATRKCAPKTLLRGKNASIAAPSRAWPCKWHNDCETRFHHGIRLSTTNCVNGVCIPDGIGRDCEKELYNFGCNLQLTCLSEKCQLGFEGALGWGEHCIRGLFIKEVGPLGGELSWKCFKGRVPDYAELERVLDQNKFENVESGVDRNGWGCS